MKHELYLDLNVSKTKDDSFIKNQEKVWDGRHIQVLRNLVTTTTTTPNLNLIKNTEHIV